jgi:mannose/cellobiose epimerase-like protein (N-acyl-D-glucosamine 2-epimerase family)
VVGAVQALPAFLISDRSRMTLPEAISQCGGLLSAALYDPEHGEWYHSTNEDGTPRSTEKGSAWKAAYHVTQALSYAHQYLQEMGR